MKHKYWLVQFACFSFLTFVAGFAWAAALSAEQRFSELRKVEIASNGSHRSELERQQDIESAYGRLFDRKSEINDKSERDTAQVKATFEASNLVAFYTRKAKYIQAMADVLHELETRHAATPAEFIDYYRILIATRQFDVARTFAARHPGTAFETLPPIKDLVPKERKGPTELAVTEVGLTRLPVDVGTASLVVVIAHPLCHFSQNAANEIAADSGLSSALKDAIWLAPPDGNLRLDLFLGWNRNHPGQQMALAYTKSEWPVIDSWETPTFYFFRKGILIGKISGWPAQGHSKELQDQLEKLRSQ